MYFWSFEASGFSEISANDSDKFGQPVRSFGNCKKLWGFHLRTSKSELVKLSVSGTIEIAGERREGSGREKGERFPAIVSTGREPGKC